MYKITGENVNKAEDNGFNGVFLLRLSRYSGETCEFNFGAACVGHGARTDNGQDTYGMPMEEAKKMFPDSCDDYGISFDALIEQEKINGI